MTRTAIVAFLLAAPLPAQPLSVGVSDLYHLDAPRDVALSPDGKSAAWSRQWIDRATKTERTSLWKSDGKNSVALEANEPDARVPVWSPDCKWIAFVSTRPRPEGWQQTPQVPTSSDPAADVWLIPSEGGKAIPLAGEKKPFARAFHDGFYGRLTFSPDGKKLAFVADDGIAVDDQGEGYTGYGPAQLWVAHLADKPGVFAASKIERITNDDVWWGDPQWMPDGNALVVHANRTADRESVRYSINKNFDIWSIDLATKKVTQLTTGPGPEVSPRVSPDGKKIACLSVPRKGSHRDAFNPAIIDLNGAEPGFRVTVDRHDRDPDNLGFGRVPSPAFPLPLDAWKREGYLRYDLEAGTATQPVWEDDAGCTSPAKPDPRIAPLVPPPNPALAGRAIAPQKVVKWKSSDGLEIEGVLTTPHRAAPFPLIVFPHGGPHSRSTIGFDFTVQVFAAHGYAVFQPNFRGSSGYGQKFIDADRGDFGGGDFHDIMTGVDELIRSGVADKHRLFHYGTSYGGYLTTWAVGQTNRFRAAVAINAVTDLTMMWSLSDIPSWTEWEFGGRPWTVPEQMRKHSPLTYVERVKTPTLMLHSLDDRRVPLPLGQAFHRALKSRGVPTELVIYPGEGHGIRQPQHREDVLRRTLAWFEKYDRKE